MVTLKHGYHVVTLKKQCQVVVDQTRSIVEARVSDMQAIAFSAMPIRVYLDERHALLAAARSCDGGCRRFSGGMML